MHDILIASFFTDDRGCAHENRDHTLIYIAEGELDILCDGGQASNVVPDFAEIDLTVRQDDPQVALAWLLQKEDWIVPIPGTTKESHLLENLHTLAFKLHAEEWRDLERMVDGIAVVGDRYNAEQQKQVQ